MEKGQQTLPARRIDLSKCKLLAPYGRNAADSLVVGPKIGGIIKTGILGKIGTIVKLSPVSSRRLARS